MKRLKKIIHTTECALQGSGHVHHLSEWQGLPHNLQGVMNPPDRQWVNAVFDKMRMGGQGQSGGLVHPHSQRGVQRHQVGVVNQRQRLHPLPLESYNRKVYSHIQGLNILGTESNCQTYTCHIYNSFKTYVTNIDLLRSFWRYVVIMILQSLSPNHLEWLTGTIRLKTKHFLVDYNSR